MNESTYKYKNAAKGLEDLYQASCILLIDIIVSVISAFALSKVPFLAIMFMVLGLGWFLEEVVVGFWYIAKDIPGCWAVFILQVIFDVLTFGIVWIPFINILGIITAIIALVSQLMFIVIIINTVKKVGATAAVRWGWLSFWFFMLTSVLIVANVISIIIGIIFSSLTLIQWMACILAGVSLITLIFYMLFLKESSEVLGAYY